MTSRKQGSAPAGDEGEREGLVGGGNFRGGAVKGGWAGSHDDEDDGIGAIFFSPPCCPFQRCGEGDPASMLRCVDVQRRPS